MDLRKRPTNPAALEARERTWRILAAARKGKTPAQIADTCEYPLKLVQQTLAPIPDTRLADPADLLNKRPALPGLPAPDVQMYWLGFLSAAGRICGQGASFALIITLGTRSQEHMNMFVQDVATPQVRNEYCSSSLLGWQLYVRDQGLCKALLRWGIPSDLHGDEPGVLDDIPAEFAAPFVHGYVDGNWAPADVGAPRSNGLLLYGTETILGAVNRMVKRAWGVTGGVITPRGPRSQLRFNRQDGHAILTRSRAYTERRRTSPSA
ncbi:MAG TPA: hypothetical protein VKW09_15655 [bacterium]|nr:hypothetical protein [bacterium]